MPNSEHNPHDAEGHPGGIEPVEVAGPGDAPESGEGLWDGVLLWSTRAAVAGWVLSMLIHLVIMILAAWVTLRAPAGDAGGDGPASAVEFAVMTESELASMLAAAEESLEPRAPESDLAPDPASMELLEASTTVASSLAESMVEVEISAGAGEIGDPGGDGLLTGGGGGGASFFGLEAQGNRFAYIVDRSSSMRGEKWTRTQAELTRSIMELPEIGQFMVIYFSDGAEPLGGRAQWIEATERGQTEARRLIAGVSPMGGTRPHPAFEMVFGSRIKPDAIYFMTDGEFASEVPAQVAAMNRRLRIPVHCIMFGEVSPNSVIAGEVRAMMEQIARDSGGRFRHVEFRP